MDPVSHVAFGRTLIALAKPHGPAQGIVGAALLGSLIPDADAVLMPFGWDRYLRVHEIGTHSLAGTLICACLTALLVRTIRRETPLTWLVAAAWAGTLGHVTLDLVSGARLQLGWPLAGGRWSVPLVAMADPILLSLLVGGVVLLMVAGRSRQRRAAATALSVVAAFLALKGWLALAAISNYESTQARQAEAATARVVEARWGSLREWTIFDRTNVEVRAWRSIAGRPGLDLLLRWPLARPTGIAAASRRLPAVENFLHVHDLPLVTIVPMADGHQAVLWSDIRFCRTPALTDAKTEEWEASSEAGSRLVCGLWFGGEFDQGGRPLRQLVRVGTITQSRK